MGNFQAMRHVKSQGKVKHFKVASTQDPPKFKFYGKNVLANNINNKKNINNITKKCPSFPA